MHEISSKQTSHGAVSCNAIFGWLRHQCWDMACTGSIWFDLAAPHCWSQAMHMPTMISRFRHLRSVHVMSTCDVSEDCCYWSACGCGGHIPNIIRQAPSATVWSDGMWDSVCDVFVQCSYLKCIKMLSWFCHTKNSFPQNCALNLLECSSQQLLLQWLSLTLSAAVVVLADPTPRHRTNGGERSSSPSWRQLGRWTMVNLDRWKITIFYNKTLGNYRSMVEFPLPGQHLP